MSAVRCPRCRDEVTVPPGATAQALVRCPLCLEQYLLAEALANSPPLLVIIGGDVPEAAIQRPTEAEADYKITSGGFSPAVFESPGPTSTVTIPRPAIRTGRRPQRKEKSGLLFVVNVVAGGLLAAPLALLTLWWIFGVDPPELGPLGPKVARITPWIVPAALRGQEPADVSVDTAPPIAKPKPMKNSHGMSGLQQPTNNSAELQTLPGLDEAPQPSITTLRPSVDAPREEPKSNQPMPDLKDLLPD